MKNLPLILAAAVASAAAFIIAASADESAYRKAAEAELSYLMAARFAPQTAREAERIMQALYDRTLGESLRHSAELGFGNAAGSGTGKASEEHGKGKARTGERSGRSFISGKYRALASLAVIRLLILRKCLLHLITVFAAALLAGLAVSTARRTSFIPPRPGARFIAGITLALSAAVLAYMLVRPHAETPSELVLSAAAIFIAAGLSVSAEIRTESV
ncbi:MAG: hypothetical protein II152_08940 [Succinivibrionaceae bacterium]|nr:hypothetical protein [Succinivibrionaceae bacterium]